jgi:hypothetical protein
MYGAMYLHNCVLMYVPVTGPSRAGSGLVPHIPGPASLRSSPRCGGHIAMARKKISTTIYITPDQAERLKLLHERTKVPVAVYIREGIDLVLEKHASALPGQLSLEDTARKR